METNKLLMLMTGNRLYGNSLRVPRIDKERERERGADYLARARFDCLVSATRSLIGSFVCFSIPVYFESLGFQSKLKKKEFSQSML